MGNYRGGTVDLLARLRSTKLKEDISKAQKMLRKFGRQAENMGRSMTRGLTVPIGLAGVAATKFAVDLNKGMANVHTMMSGGVEDARKLRKEIQDLARSSGKSTGDLTDGMYQVLSSFGETADSFKTLELASKGAIAGLASTKDTISLLKIVTDNYGDTSLPAMQKTLDMAFGAVKAGVTTFGELAGAMGKVVPIASSFNVSQQELWAIMGAGTGVAGNTAEVVTQLRGAVAGLLKPTEELRGMYKDLNINAQALIAEKGLTGAWKVVRERAEAAGKPLTKYLERIEALNLIMAITGESHQKVNDLMQKFATTSGQMAEAYKKNTEGINEFGHAVSQLRQSAIAVLQDLGIVLIDTFGSEVTSSLKGLIDSLGNLVKWFSELDPVVQKMAAAFTLVVVAIGPLLVIGGKLATLLGGKLLLKTVAFTAKLGVLASMVVWIKSKMGELRQAVENLGRSLSKVKFVPIKFEEYDAKIKAAKEAARAQEAIAAMEKKVEREIRRERQLTYRDAKERHAEYRRMKADRVAAAKEIAAWEKKQGDAAKKTGKEYEKLFKEIQRENDRTVLNIKRNNIIEALNEAMANMDTTAFRANLEKLKEASRDVFLAGLDESIQKYPELIAKALERFEAEWSHAEAEHIESMADTLAEEQKRAYEEGIDYWRRTFENAITGVTFDLEDMLKQVAVGFAAEIANALVGGVTGANIGSPQDMGGLLAQLIFGTVSGAAGMQGGAAGAGVGVGGGEVGAGITAIVGGAEALEAGSLMAAAEMMALSIAISKGIEGLFELGQSSEATAEGLGTIGGATAGWFVGGPIGAAVGAFAGEFLGGEIGEALFGDDTHPGTIARKDAFERLNEQFEKMGGLRFMDDEGAVRYLESLNLGKYKKMESLGWAEELEGQYGTDKFLAATGLGEALEEMLELSEDVGSHIGAALLENVGGSIDGLRILMKKLGINIEQVQEQLIQLGITGEMSWHEVEVALQQTTKAFGEGRQAVGDIEGALLGVLASGGRGIEAIEELRNIAIEAIEANLGSFEEVKARLVASGKFTQAEIDALMTALEKRGIASLEDLANASERTLGGIIADMQSLGVEWKEVTDDIKETTEALSNLDGSVFRIKVEGDIDPELQKLLDQVENETPGEVDTEPPPPAPVTAAATGGTRVYYNIDASGAASGVGDEILAAIQMAEQAAYQAAMENVR